MQQARTQLPVVFAAALIFLWVYTGVSKLGDLPLFIRTLNKVPVIAPFGRALAYLLPAVELAVAALLLTTRYRSIGFAFSFLLLLVFSLYITGLLLFAHELPCSCGGVLQQIGWGEHLVLNALFMTLAAGGWYLEKRGQQTDTNALLQ